MMRMQNIIAKLRHVFDENKVAFQLTEMGKIDAGGGGTIALYSCKLRNGSDRLAVLQC